MIRYLNFLKKEMLTLKSHLPFHFIAIASPLLFFFIFSQKLAEDISFPVRINPESGINTEFSESLSTYTNQSGTNYYRIQDVDENFISEISVYQDVNIIDDKLTGEIEQTFYGFNTNMLKNYRNRFHGALNGRIREIFPGYIRIAETPLYSVEPAWIEYMSVTIICFGILLSGFLFASLSVSTDRGLKHFFHYSRISPIAIYSAKFTGAFIKTLLTAFIYIAVIQSFLIQLPVPHFTFIAGICIPAFFSINAGLLLGGLTDNPIVTFLISLISALVLWLSGGGFGTAMVVGPLLRKIAWLNPANGCIKLLINSWFGGSSSEILHIIYPVLLGLTCCVFGLSVFNKKYYLPGGLK